MSDRAAPWAALAGLATSALLALYLSVTLGGDVTRIYCVDAYHYERWNLDEHYPAGELTLVPDPYDSLFFLALANDPLLRRTEPARDGQGWRFYRARRIGYAWAGWLLGAGQPRAILYALPAASVLAAVLGTAVLASFALGAGRHPAWSLLYPASLGSAICLLRPLSDLFATSLLLAGLWLWERKRSRRPVAVAAFTLAALTRATTLVLPFALALAKLREGALRRALPLAICPAAMLAWWAYVRSGSPDTDVSGSNFGLPFAGILEKLGRADDPLTPLAMSGALVGVAVVVAAPARRWDALRWAGLGYAAIAVLTTTKVWSDVWAYGRVHMTLPALTLAMFLRGGRRVEALPAVLSAIAGIGMWIHYL